MMASAMGHAPCITTLVELGGILGVRDSVRGVPLHIRSNIEAAAALLLLLLAQERVRTKEGHTCLHLAALYGRAAAAAELVRLGIDVSAVDSVRQIAHL